jgi:hypothetical protein
LLEHVQPAGTDERDTFRMAERKRFRNQLAHDHRGEHQGNCNDSDREGFRSSRAQIEAMPEERAEELLSAGATNRPRHDAHEGNTHLDCGQSSLWRFAQT